MRRVLLSPWAIALGAVAVRGAAWVTWSRWPGSDAAIVDVAWHDRLARAWLDGTASPETWSVAPGLAAVLALGHLLGLEAPIAQAALQCAMGVGAVVAVWALGRRLGGDGAGAAAGWLAAICGPLVFQDLALAGVAPAMAALAAATLLATRPSRGAALAAGIALGLGVWLRPNLLLVAPVLAIATGRRAWAVALGVALALAPATARNRIEGGEWVLLSANGGYNLAFAQTPGLDANLPPMPPGNLDDVTARARATASEALGHAASVAEADRWWRAEALRRLREDPGGALVRTAKRAALAFGALDTQDHRAWHAHRRDRFGWLPDPTLAIPGLALWGLWVGRGRREVRVAAAGLAAAGVGVALFLVIDRYRLPLYGIVLPLAGVGLARLRPVAIPLVVAVAGLASVEPFKGELRLPPLLAQPLGVRSTLEAEGVLREVDELANVAVAFARDGRSDAALDFFALALRRQPGDVAITEKAAAVAIAAGKPERAAAWLGDARRRSPRDADLALVACGVLLHMPEQAQAARVTCEAARTLAPGSASAWWQAGMARWQVGLRPEAEAAMVEALKLDPRIPGGASALARLRAEATP